MELDHEDLLPLCMLSVTLLLGHSSSAEIEWKEIQLPGLGSCKVSITNVLVSGFMQKENLLLCLSFSRGTCAHVCVCGVRPGLVDWGGEDGKQDRPWVGCKSSPERGCRVYHLWGTLSESVTDHTVPLSSCLCLVLRSSQPHPYPSNPSTHSFHLTVEDGSLEAQSSSWEAELGSHFKKDNPATIIKI